MSDLSLWKFSIIVQVIGRTEWSRIKSCLAIITPREEIIILKH